MTDHPPLKLKARSEEDVTVISSLLQDALVASQDMQFHRADNSFVVLANRYGWEQASQEKTRRLCGLKIGHVQQVQTKQMQLDQVQFYNLLSIAYEDTEKWLILTFSGGATIRLRVRKLQLILQDVAVAHPSLGRPEHNLDD